MIILIGLQASGKSTFYSTHFSSTHVHVSKDLLHRSKLKNKDQIQTESIEAAFQKQRSVIIDNTNVTLQDRLSLIDLGRRYGATITGYYFQSDVSNSRTYNKQRTGKAQVPEKAIFITAHKLVPPTYAEGFDTLYYVRIDEGSTIENPTWKVEKIPFKGKED